MDYTNQEFILTPEELEAWEDSYEWFINGANNELLTDEAMIDIFRDQIKFSEDHSVNGVIHSVYGFDHDKLIKLAAENGYICGGTTSFEIIQEDTRQVVIKILSY